MHVLLNGFYPSLQHQETRSQGRLGGNMESLLRSGELINILRKI